MRRRYAVALLMFVAIAATIPAVGAETHRVTVNDNFYDPEDITIEKGDTVEWRWLADNHSVTFDDGADSGVRQKLNTWSRTFDEYGTFFYKCTVHGLAMSGSVIVPAPDPDTCEELGTCPKEIWVPSDAPTVAEAIDLSGDSTIVYLEPGTHVVSQTVEVAASNVTIRGASKITTTTTTTTATSDDSTSISVESDPETKVKPSKAKDASGQKAKPSPSPTGEPSPSPSPSPTVEPSPSPSPKPTPGPVNPEEVVIKARGGFASAFEVTGDGFSMHSLTIESFRDSAVDVIGAKRFRFEDLRLLINREYGIRSIGGRFGVIEDVYVTGSTRAGVSIQDCELCDVSVSRLTSVGNFNGFEALDAGSVMLNDSTLSNNANGVLLRTRVKPSPAFQDGVHIYGNQILHSGDPGAPAPSLFRANETQDVGAGAGVWISGGWRNVIEANSISGSLYGVAITAYGSGSMYNEISSNSIADSASADLGWDGLGVGNCFSDNGGSATSDPPALQTTHSCDGAGGPGVLNPAVSARLFETAWSRYYCPELDGICPER